MVEVVAGLLMRDGEALLGLRKANGKRGGLWECPGGKVDPGETHMAALCREWQEELGVHIIDGGERLGTVLLDLEVCFTVTLYVVHAVQGDLQALDHSELRWVDLRHAIEYMPCSPAMYLHWSAVRAWIASRATMTSPRSEPTTTDYCVTCGDSPDSAIHLIGRDSHEYVDLRGRR